MEQLLVLLDRNRTLYSGESIQLVTVLTTIYMLIENHYLSYLFISFDRFDSKSAISMERCLRISKFASAQSRQKRRKRRVVQRARRAEPLRLRSLYDSSLNYSLARRRACAALSPNFYSPASRLLDCETKGTARSRNSTGPR